MSEKVSRLIFEQKAQQVLNLTVSEKTGGSVARTGGIGEFAIAVPSDGLLLHRSTKVAIHTVALSGV